MTDSRIEGFVAGSTELTVSNLGGAVTLTAGNRLQARIEAVLSPAQSKRLRMLLSAAERRAKAAVWHDIPTPRSSELGPESFK